MKNRHLPDCLLNEKEVASKLNVCVATLRRWRWAGKEIPYIKIGGAVRYDPDDLDAYIESCRRKCTSEADPGYGIGLVEAEPVS